MSKVSVIVPNYNHEKYLKRRLESILNQTMQDFEIIFLDDASTDDSVEVYKKIIANRPVVIKEIFSDINSGSPFIQWNKGAQIADGEYLWFAESDDFSDREFLAQLVNILDTNSRVGIAYCQSYFVDENDEIIGSNLKFTSDLDTSLWKDNFIMDGKQFCRDYEIFKNPVHNASSALFRKSAWNKIGPADEKMKRCGDWMQVVKILENSDIAFVSEHLNYYRNNPLSWEPVYPLIFDIKDEEYQIFSYIRDRFNVNLDTIDKRADQLCREWVGRVVYNSNHSEHEKIKNVFKYYQKFKNYDDKMRLRVIKNLTSEYGNKAVNKFKELLV